MYRPADSEADASGRARRGPPASARLAVVVPAYRAAETVCGVIAGIGLEVERIYLVDDACPEGSGDRVQTAFPGPRVVVLRNGRNLGVGGAVKRGYAQALADGMDAVVKLDGDGQMDPAALSRLVAPVLAGEADYAKGNRFGRGRGRLGRPPEDGSRPMPTARRIGNNIASFAHKWITGYWNIVDPANGYTAIGRAALGRLDLEALADCYFFETDMLFQLGLLDAVVVDVPVPPRYGSEKSHLRIRNVVAKYPLLALRRGAQRVWIKYFVQDFNVASLEVAAGVPLFGFGLVAGGYGWAQAVATGRAATAGTVMFAALPIILGFQLLLSAISYDIARTPTVPLARLDRD